MGRPDPSREDTSSRGSQIAVYVQTIAAAVMVLFSVIDSWRFSSLLPPAAITAVFLAAAVITVSRSRRARKRVPAIAVAVALIGGVIVAGSWIGLSVAGSDKEEDGSAEREEPEVAGDTTPSPPGEGAAEATHSDRLCTKPAESAAAGWFLYETAGGERQITVEQDGEPIWSIPGAAFSAAGPRIVYADATDLSRVEVVSLTTRQVVGSKAMSGMVRDTTISRDGDTVVLVEDRSGDTRLVLWRPSTDEVIVLLDPLADLSAPALSPLGDRLAWVQGANSSGRVVVADLATLSERVVADGGSDPAWSPDGSSLVYSAPYGEGRAIHAAAAGGGEGWLVTSPVQANDYDPAVLPSCDGVVYARAQGGLVDLWETREDGTEERLRNLSGAQSRPAFASE